MNKKPDVAAAFNPDCVRCPRIAKNLALIKKQYPDYHCRPVAPFGSSQPSLLIVGLGPGLHGANATGRPFTGDHAGILLYQMLHDFGFSNQAVSQNRKDGLVLTQSRITNAVKCLPPANKPLPEEIRTCNAYLKAELASFQGRLVILTLGRIAHEAVLRALGLKPKDHPFAHNALHQLSEKRHLLDSYHCSRYNTQTRRLTEPMFRQIFTRARQIVDGHG